MGVTPTVPNNHHWIIEAVFTVLLELVLTEGWMSMNMLIVTLPVVMGMSIHGLCISAAGRVKPKSEVAPLGVAFFASYGGTHFELK